MNRKVKKRHLEMMAILEKEKEIHISQMAKLFQVSTETIRTDFEALQENFGVIRGHGSLRWVESVGLESSYHFEQQKDHFVEEKKRICYHAASLIKDGQCIYLDSGTTVSYLLPFLHSKKNLTIVTPSVALLMKYIMDLHAKQFRANYNRFIFTGGEIDQEILTAYGTFFDQSIDAFSFDMALASFDGISMERGASNRDEIAYAMIRKVINRAEQMAVLVDHSKLEQTHRYKTMDWNRIDYLITDKNLDKKWIEFLLEKKVQYFRA